MAEILVCDDDKDIVEAIEIYLTQEGYHILKAYDGEQAIQVLPVSYTHLDVYKRQGRVLQSRYKSIRRFAENGICRTGVQ